MTSPTDTASVLQTLGKGLETVSSALTIADRAAGLVGRGGPRWHLWRALRLRIRAVNAEASGRPAAKVKALRTRAALHLESAARQAGPDSLTAAYEARIAALKDGREPLA